MYRHILFYITLFLLILAYSFNAANYDYDLWARLIAGMGAVESGHVLKADFLSYTPTHIWFDHEWGSGVVFYLCLKYFGPCSLVILHTSLIWGMFFVISKTVALRSKEPYNILFYFFALFVIMANINTPVRCQLFTFLFFALFIYLLELSQRGNKAGKRLWVLPLVVIIWNNLHGGVVAGLGLIFIYMIGALFPHSSGGTPEVSRLRYFAALGMTFVLSCAALLINPWGFDYIKFLIDANTMPRPYIIEWWGIFAKHNLFAYIPFKLFMLFAAAVVVSCARAGRARRNITKYLVLALTLYLAVSHTKLIPFFVIAVCVYCYDDFYNLIKRWNFPAWKDRVVYGLLLFCGLFSLFAKELTPPLNFSAYPVKEVEFLKINDIKGNLLINFGLGSYAAYKLYPDNLIFMDGRYEEVYYDYMVPLLRKFYLAEPGWDEILDRFPPRVMIVEKYYPVYELLKNDWTLVYEGAVFGVFVPNGGRQEYKQPPDDINYYKKTLFNTAISW